jgi:hypothetical protein
MEYIVPGTRPVNVTSRALVNVAVFTAPPGNAVYSTM